MPRLDAMLKRLDARASLFVLAMLLQLPLILNPGYYSHDELQWASWSYLRAWHEIPWQSPWDLDTFQYRPLTFNLWMLLNYGLFDQPYLMHAAQALMASLTLLLLHALMGQYGIQGPRRVIACLLWLCFPFVVYVHGWIGTFADQIWLSAGLLSLLLTARCSERAHAALPFLAGAATTLIGLLAKEAALVIPAFLLAHIWLLPARRRLFVWAFLGSALVAFLYLSLRLKIILTGAETSGDYRPTWFEAPKRLLEYWLFPGTIQRPEPHNILLVYSKRLALSAIGIALLFFGLACQRWRHLLMLLVLPTLALGPTLALAYPAGQYAYGFATVIIVLLAHASIDLPRRWLAFAALWCALTITHGLNLMHQIPQIGRAQTTLLTGINALLKANPQQAIRVRTVYPDDEWWMRRSLFKIASYHGVSWQGRVDTETYQDPDRQATHVMLRDGRLVPAPTAPP